MKFICTGKGFVAGTQGVKNEDGKTIYREVIYTTKLREAQTFSKLKVALLFIKSYQLEGFVYSPLHAEHILDDKKYIVHRYKDVYEFTGDDKILEEGFFRVTRISDSGYSDLNFLQKRPRNWYEGETLMTKEEALEECIRRNNLLIEKLTKENEINSTRRFK